MEDVPHEKALLEAVDTALDVLATYKSKKAIAAHQDLQKALTDYIKTEIGPRMQDRLLSRITTSPDKVK